MGVPSRLEILLGPSNGREENIAFALLSSRKAEGQEAKTAFGWLALRGTFGA